jgi:hypothetical protein
MAAVTIGQAGLVFGVTTESFGLVQSFSETRNIEKNEVRNSQGDVVGVAYYNATTGYAISFATTSSYGVAAGTALAVLANAATIGTARIDSVTINKSNDAFVTVDISATGYPNI